MDKGNFKKLNGYHIVFLTQSTMLGLGLFSLPNDISNVGYNQWLIPIILGLVANLSLLPIIALCKKFPSDSLFKINEKILGSVIGKVANFFLLLYAIISVTSVSQSYIKLVQTVVLPQYPITVSSISFFLVLICIVNGGIKSIARFCMFAIFITSWLTVYLKWAFQAGNWLHIIPTFEVGGEQWFRALLNGSVAMFGYGVLLFYYPYIKNQKKALLYTSIGIWIAVFFYVLVSLASVVYFSPWQLANILYPVLNLFQAVQLAFVERIENFGTALWVFLILSTSSIYLWVAKKGLDALLSKHKNRTWHLYVIAFVSWFLLAGPIPFQIQVILYEEWRNYYGYGLLLFPIFLLIVHKFKSGKGKEAFTS
ncbi:endospore germination permease [Halalkalibacter kiskunsagensis]|uniref:Endospore germination permease n=1 Tax=Halalkalibacter kiskunsagensis TaxID=1548599 RepID=A0ABV6KIL5_9BACI